MKLISCISLSSWRKSSLPLWFRFPSNSTLPWFTKCAAPHWTQHWEGAACRILTQIGIFPEATIFNDFTSNSVWYLQAHTAGLSLACLIPTSSSIKLPAFNIWVTNMLLRPLSATAHTDQGNTSTCCIFQAKSSAMESPAVVRHVALASPVTAAEMKTKPRNLLPT